MTVIICYKIKNKLNEINRLKGYYRKRESFFVKTEIIQSNKQNAKQ